MLFSPSKKVLSRRILKNEIDFKLSHRNHLITIYYYRYPLLERQIYTNQDAMVVNEKYSRQQNCLAQLTKHCRRDKLESLTGFLNSGDNFDNYEAFFPGSVSLLQCTDARS